MARPFVAALAPVRSPPVVQPLPSVAAVAQVALPGS